MAATRQRSTVEDLARHFEGHAQAEDAGKQIAEKQGGVAAAIVAAECHAAAVAYRRCAAELLEYYGVEAGAEDPVSRN